MVIEKFCTRCGKKFLATGREVICPACKQAAAEESKRAAVLRAKRASWSGESVPVRISGRASAVIRQYGAEHNLPFASALDALLKASDFFVGMKMAWEDITPYKSHRRDKHATEDVKQDKLEQDKPQDVKQDVPQEAQEVKAAKVASKTSTSKKATSTAKTATVKKAVKTSTSKDASKTSKAKATNEK